LEKSTKMTFCERKILAIPIFYFFLTNNICGDIILTSKKQKKIKMFKKYTLIFRLSFDTMKCKTVLEHFLLLGSESIFRR